MNFFWQTVVTSYVIGVIFGWNIIPQPLFIKNFLTWGWESVTTWIKSFFVKKG